MGWTEGAARGHVQLEEGNEEYGVTVVGCIYDEKRSLPRYDTVSLSP